MLEDHDEWVIKEVKELTDSQKEILHNKDQISAKIEIGIDTQIRLPLINNSPKKGLGSLIRTIVANYCKNRNIHKDDITFIRIKKVKPSTPNESEKDRTITVSCSTCKRVLYKGSEEDSKGLIIYCDKC
jgi:hypothetical protein